jgi:hypothetical protein
LLLQFARAKTGRGGRQTPPYAFTELGVAMLSSVVNSDRAVQMNILIMRAFVRLREALAMNEALAYRIDELAATQHEHAIALIGWTRGASRVRVGASHASAFTLRRSSPRGEYRKLQNSHYLNPVFRSVDPQHPSLPPHLAHIPHRTGSATAMATDCIDEESRRKARICAVAARRESLIRKRQSRRARGGL